MEAGTGALGARGAVPRRMARRVAVTAVAAALLVGGTALWEVHGRQLALDRAVSSNDAARSEASALQEEVGGLQGRITTLQHNADALAARMARMSGSRQHLAARLGASAQRLRSAQARMTALLGSPPADGRYFGAVVLVGADQTPPRLVIDLEQWLTDDAAQQAAIDHGYPHAENGYFIEDDSPTWHTIEIASTATVSIVDLHSEGGTRQDGSGVVGTAPITLERLAHSLALGRAYNPFWISVSGGRITSIEEEYLP